jgi:hypothetical protein
MASTCGQFLLGMFNEVATQAAEHEGLTEDEFVTKFVNEAGAKAISLFNGARVDAVRLVCLGILLDIEKAAEIATLGGVSLEEAFDVLMRRKMQHADPKSQAYGRG